MNKNVSPKAAILVIAVVVIIVAVIYFACSRPASWSTQRHMAGAAPMTIPKGGLNLSAPAPTAAGKKAPAPSTAGKKAPAPLAATKTAPGTK
jgi:hypothetical protein